VRWLAGAPTIVLVLTACMPAVAPIADGAAPEGPQLAIEVVNSSDQDLGIGYEFESGQNSGAGEASVGHCEQVALGFGTISGRYSLLLDGEALTEGPVPTGAPADAWLVVRVHVDPDGEGKVIGTRIVAERPDSGSRPIADCG